MMKNQKHCKSCNKTKPSTDFHLDKSTNDGLAFYCKECKNKFAKKYYKNNYNKCRETRDKYYTLNKDKINEYRKHHPEVARRARAKIRKERPWVSNYQKAKQRCEDKNNNRFYCYGARGIKMLMSADDFKTLWFRDKAYLMDRPSIDRKDNDGHYVYDNCRFMELSENITKRNREVNLVT